MAQGNNHPHPDLIQAFFDQTLDPQSAGALQEHLGACQQCQAELACLTSLAGRLAALPEFSLARDLSPGVLSRLSASEPLARGITWTLTVEALLASLAVAVLIPAIQVPPWSMVVQQARQQLLGGAQIFLAQLASGWVVWWAKLELSLKSALGYLQSWNRAPASLPSPWFLVLVGAGLAILVNMLLLRRSPQKNHP